MPLALRPVFESVWPILRQPPPRLVRAETVLGGIGLVECGSDLRRSIARRLPRRPGNRLAFGTAIRHSWLILRSRAAVAMTVHLQTALLLFAQMVPLDLHQNTNELRW